jgi:wobble nucleotide-excising tRNase
MSGQHPHSDITVITDDPIGSLDANHLFKTRIVRVLTTPESIAKFLQEMAAALQPSALRHDLGAQTAP